MRIAVDFPAPFGPRNPKMLPGGTASESPARAVVLPYNFQTFFRTIGSAASGINVQTPGNWGKFRATRRYLNGKVATENTVLESPPDVRGELAGCAALAIAIGYTGAFCNTCSPQLRYFGLTSRYNWVVVDVTAEFPSMEAYRAALFIPS